MPSNTPILMLRHCCFLRLQDFRDLAHYEFMGPAQPLSLSNKTFIHLAYTQAHFSQWLIQAFKTSPHPDLSKWERSFLSRNSSPLPWISPYESGVKRAIPSPPTSLRGRNPFPPLQGYLFPGVLKIIPFCSLSLLYPDYFPQITLFPSSHQTCVLRSPYYQKSF